MGMFRASDEYCYDWMLATKPSATNNQDILLVYAPRSFFLESECHHLSKLTESLDAFGARRIGLLFAPDKHQLETLNGLPFAAKLVTGKYQSLSGDKNSDAKAAAGIEQGFIDLQLDQSVYREHRAQTADVESPSASLENIIASDYLPASVSLPKQDFGVRFVGGPNCLPNVHADEVINKEIVSELVRDKIILIGLEQDEEIGFVTPSTRFEERMSRLELHGNILNTLLKQNHLRSTGIAFSITILLLVTFFSCQLFRQISQQNIFRGYLFWMIFVAVASWTAFHFGSLKLPITGIVLATSVALSNCLYLRWKTLNEFFDSWSLMRQTGSQADWKAEERDTWTLISDSVYQNFYPNRMVLMELNPGATHLTTNKTIHCTPDQILERRRDFNRAPYREAVELGAAMKIEYRQFFTIDHDKECIEYIAPLILVSELVGFMVLEMTAESVKHWDDFENFLTHFASDMAVLVNKYRVLQHEQSREQKLLEKLKEVPERTRKQAVFQAEVEHRNMENLLGDAFERIQTAGAIFDVFGRNIKTNAKMIELLQQKGIVVGDTDSVSLLESLTDWEKNDCRKLLRQTVVDGRTQEIYLAQEDGQDAPRVLYLEPLNKGEDEPEISSRCVCIQIVEGKIFEDSMRWQNDFVSGNAHEVANRLEELERLACQIQSSDENDPDRDRIEVDILAAISDCREILGKKIGQDPQDCLLFDSLSVWQSALDRARPNLDERGISVSSRFSAPSIEALANPILLHQVFETVLACVSHDASEESEILVTAEKVDTKVVFQFSDVVGDAPIMGLRKSLDLETDPTPGTALQGISVSVLTPSQIDQFREIEGWLECWDANLSIRCCANYRVNIELVLSTESRSVLGIMEVDSEKPATIGTLKNATDGGGRA